MHTVDVLIVGGGVGGLSCAITLASAENKPWFGNRTVLVLDDGRSDLAKARSFNAPGIPPGTSGKQTLLNMRDQLAQYDAASLIIDRVVKAKRKDGIWTIIAESGAEYECHIVVLATGYKRWEIDELPASPIPHPRGGKLDRIMLEHDGAYCVATDLYVAGLLGGGSSQFAIASGIGAQVGVEILSCWAGKRTHVHDVPETPVT